MGQHRSRNMSEYEWEWWFFHTGKIHCQDCFRIALSWRLWSTLIHNIMNRINNMWLILKRFIEGLLVSHEKSCPKFIIFTRYTDDDDLSNCSLQIVGFWDPKLLINSQMILLVNFNSQGYFKLLSYGMWLLLHLLVLMLVLCLQIWGTWISFFFSLKPKSDKLRIQEIYAPDRSASYISETFVTFCLLCYEQRSCEVRSALFIAEQILPCSIRSQLTSEAATYLTQLPLLHRQPFIRIVTWCKGFRIISA